MVGLQEMVEKVQNRNEARGQWVKKVLNLGSRRPIAT